MTFFSVTAWAEVDIKRAKEHYTKAESLYRVERFQDAFTEYQEAYLAKPEPNLLFNMAQCQRKMGNRPEAVRFYRRFLAEKPNPPNLATVEQHLRDLEAVQPPTTLPPPLAMTASPALAAAPAPSTMRKGFTAPVTAKPAAPPPVLSPAVAYNQPPAGALEPVGIRSASVPAVTTPPPVAAPTLPPQSLAMAHDPGKSPTSPNVLRTDGGPGPDSAPGEARPIYKKWWFWAVVGGAVAGAVVIGVVAGHKSDPSCSGLVACQ
ncbi:MAG TPA: hypothetical protein VNO55_16395 [Polyangia bacterium]|nr:hypothetical protein [Polyangia bacterium]